MTSSSPRTEEQPIGENESGEKKLVLDVELQGKDVRSLNDGQWGMISVPLEAERVAASAGRRPEMECPD